MESKDQIWYLKGLAIISVIYAHCPNRVSYNVVDAFLDNIRNNIGTIGVPLFIVLSGYLFHNRIPVMMYWKKKKRIIIQWLIWGTIIWGYEVARKGLGYANLFKWLMGIGSYLWYMPVILLLWLLFYYIKDARIQITLLAFSAIYHVFTYDLAIHMIDSAGIIINNVLCHMPFFIFGLCLQNKEISNFCKNIFAPQYKWLRGGITTAGIFLTIWVNENKVTYDSPLFLVFIAAIGIQSVELYRLLRKFEKITKPICWLGRNSYIIYLSHLPIAGICSSLFSRSRYLLYGVLVYPLLAVLFSALGILVLKRICGKYSMLNFLISVGEDRKQG